MASRFDVQRRVVQGNRSIVIGTDRDWRLGPFEGTWWTRYSWWVIPLGLLLIFVPWLYLAGVFSQIQKVPATVAQPPIIVAPVVVQQPSSVALSPSKDTNPWDDPRNR